MRSIVSSRISRSRLHARTRRSASTVGNKLSCPVKAARPDAAPTNFPRSCSNPKTSMRALKEHVKSIHKCTCAGGEGWCQNPAHLTAKQLNDIAQTTIRDFESPVGQWHALTLIVDPNAQLLPRYQPTTHQLVEVSQRPSIAFSKALQQRLNEVPTRGEAVSVDDFFACFRAFVDEVSRSGAMPENEPFAEHESDATLAVSPRISVSSSGTIDDARDQNAMDITDASTVAVGGAPPELVPPDSAAAPEPGIGAQSQHTPGAANDPNDSAEPLSSNSFSWLEHVPNDDGVSFLQLVDKTWK